MRLFTFLLLEVLLSPLSLTGLFLWLLWAIASSQQQSLSTTALFPLLSRWFLHLQGIRPDPVADELMKTLPSVSPPLNWLMAMPTLWAMNLSGYTPSVFNVPPPGEENLGNMINMRTLFFDRALVACLQKVEQVVVLGAGFDTRLFKFCLGCQSHLGKPYALFEVDQPRMQQVKRQALRNSGRSTGNIRFVGVNFNQENWVEKLVAAGFEPGKKTFFLWEGVTYYLTETVVTESLNAMGEICGVGSAIAFDFFPQRFLSGQIFGWLPLSMVGLDWIGEPFRFGVDTAVGDRQAIANLLAGSGFQLSQLQMMGETRHPFGFCGLVVATKTA